MKLAKAEEAMSRDSIVEVRLVGKLSHIKLLHETIEHVAEALGKRITEQISREVMRVLGRDRD